jgi:hypothetical protein
MPPFLRPARHRAFALALAALLALGATARPPAAAAADFQLAIGGVRDACTGAHLGGALLTFTEAIEHPPAPIRVATNPGGEFATMLAPGDYTVAIALHGYTQPGNTDGDPVGVFSVRTGPVNHFVFVLQSPSPC